MEESNLFETYDMNSFQVGIIKAIVMIANDLILPLVLRFSTAKDIEAMTIACKYFATQILPMSTIWKQIFCRQWELQNFKLEGIENGTTSINITDALRSKFPSTWSENRIYQILTHGIQPYPSFAVIDHDVLGNYDIENLPPYVEEQDLDKALNIGYNQGKHQIACGSRPLRMGFQIRVLKTSSNAYSITATTSGYFEISILKPSRPLRLPRASNSRQQQTSHNESICVGLACPSIFSPYVEAETDWRYHSYVYDSNNGHYYGLQEHNHNDNNQTAFGTPCGVGDIIGCGVNRSSNHSNIFFTKNGESIDSGDLNMRCGDTKLYPIVGLNSPNFVHFNFGQERFKFEITRQFDEDCNSHFSKEMLFWNVVDVVDDDDSLNDEDESLNDDYDDMYDNYSSPDEIICQIGDYYDYWDYDYASDSDSDYDYDYD